MEVYRLVRSRHVPLECVRIFSSAVAELSSVRPDKIAAAGHGEDTWAAFLSERDAIMDVLEYVPNVIVLSGDRHEFAAASLRTTVTEFSTSPCVRATGSLAPSAVSDQDRDLQLQHVLPADPDSFAEAPSWCDRGRHASQV